MHKNILTLLVVLSVLTGCFKQDSLNPNAMTYKESQSVLSIKRGVIISVEQGQVSSEGSNGVAAVGGLLGGLAGSQLGTGKGTDVAIGLGALGGAILGKTLTEKTELAFIYTIELQERGGIIQVSQTGQMLPQRSKVLVRTFSNGRKTVSADQSQGVTFSDSNDTAYEGDAAKNAAKKATAAAHSRQHQAALTKKERREEAEYQLMLESKKLDLKSKGLDVDKKSARVKRVDEYIDKELKN